MWTERQRKCAISAASKAGWNDQQRYIAMRHAGCKPSATGQISLANPSNPHGAFEQYMAIAESAAAERGEHIYPPTGKPSWNAVASGQRTRTIRLIESIYAEAQSKLSRKFHEGGLPGFVSRMTRNDTSVCGVKLWTNELEHCDSAQLYRILEGLKAWVAREMIEHGLAPSSFKLTQYQEKRLKEIQRRIA
jgi:hypothetical protein